MYLPTFESIRLDCIRTQHKLCVANDPYNVYDLIIFHVQKVMTLNMSVTNHLFE